MFHLCCVAVAIFKTTYCNVCAGYFAAGIQEFPENIKNCKVLAIVEASVNPISK